MPLSQVVPTLPTPQPIKERLQPGGPTTKACAGGCRIVRWSGHLMYDGAVVLIGVFADKDPSRFDLARFAAVRQ
jgi:hypothetical protein